MYSEISKQLGKTLIADNKCSQVVTSDLYRDEIYNILGTRVIKRNNYLSGISYHIIDINA